MFRVLYAHVFEDGLYAKIKNQQSFTIRCLTFYVNSSEQEETVKKDFW